MSRSSWSSGLSKRSKGFLSTNNGASFFSFGVSLPFPGFLIPPFPPPILHSYLLPASSSIPVQNSTNPQTTNLTQTWLPPFNQPPPNLINQVFPQNRSPTSSFSQSNRQSLILNTNNKKPNSSLRRVRKPQTQIPLSQKKQSEEDKGSS